MLDELIVSNLGVLERARIEPGDGLCVITGETGAGKTLLLGALRMLLGRAADSDLVGPFGDEAEVQGRFLTPNGGEVAAGRRLSRHGRSRAYLDGSVASAAALDQATDGLVEIIGQHDHLALTRPAEVRALVDRLLDADGAAALDRYREAWEEVARLEADRQTLGGDRPALERERETLHHQVREIDGSGFGPGDDGELETRLARLRNAEELRERLAGTVGGVDRAREELGAAVAELRRAARLDGSLDELSAELAAVEDRLGDVALQVGGVTDGLDADPGALEAAEEQYQALADLRRKYGPSLEEVLEHRERAAQRAAELDALVERADRIDADLAAAREELAEAGEALREAREQAAARLTSEAVGHLTELGFSSPVLTAEVDPAEPRAHGADVLRLRFASDSRLDPGELAKTASGGELSRVVLSLRLAGGAGSAASVAFDEVDAGVGGATALALGRKLAGLARDRQVLCVTHLPQVAAFADRHFVVHRTGTTAEVKVVEGADRVEELSRMLAGLPDSERGREAAEELLEMAAGSS